MVECTSGEQHRQSTDRVRVFVSYARSIMATADALVAAREAEDIEVTIDRRDLSFGEQWQHELSDLIFHSDTVIWLVDPRSVRSQWCLWELEEALRLNKRVLPLVVSLVHLS